MKTNTNFHSQTSNVILRIFMQWLQSTLKALKWRLFHQNSKLHSQKLILKLKRWCKRWYSQLCLSKMTYQAHAQINCILSANTESPTGFKNTSKLIDYESFFFQQRSCSVFALSRQFFVIVHIIFSSFILIEGHKTFLKSSLQNDS